MGSKHTADVELTELSLELALLAFDRKKGARMPNRGDAQVRAVVTTQFGCQERTAWFPKGSVEAIEAMRALAERQTDMFLIAWEEREETGDGPRK